MSPVGKTGTGASVDLAVGDFLPIKLTGANGLIGPRAGQSVGHYVKLISLAPDASQFKLYDTSLSRAIARCGTPCNSLPAGGTGEDRLEKYIADNLLPWAAGDFAPLEAGVVDEDTYVEQGRDLERAYSHQVIELHPRRAPARHRPRHGRLPVHGRGPAPVPGADQPDRRRRRPEPVLRRHPEVRRRPVHRDRTAGRVDIREEYIRSAYVDADEKLGDGRATDGRQPDDVRRVGPRLRPAVVRGERPQGAQRRDGDASRSTSVAKVRRTAARASRRSPIP